MIYSLNRLIVVYPIIIINNRFLVKPAEKQQTSSAGLERLQPVVSASAALETVQTFLIQQENASV